MKIRDLKVADWFYNYEGKLLFAKSINENGYVTATDGIFEYVLPGDSLCYPLTVYNKTIADIIRRKHDKLYEYDVLTPNTNRKLYEFYRKLMLLDKDNATREDYEMIYFDIDKWIEDLRYHKSFLG